MRWLPLSVLIAFFAFRQSQMPPLVKFLNIPIQNPSFQEGETGWIFTGTSTTMNWNGVPVAYAGYGGSFSQVLTVTPATLQEQRLGYPSDAIFTLKASIANYFGGYPGYVTAKISFGTQELCETSIWGTRAFNKLILTCISPGYLINDNSLPGGGPAQGNEPLTITFTVNDKTESAGWPLLFKDVSLTFTENSNL